MTVGLKVEFTLYPPQHDKLDPLKGLRQLVCPHFSKELDNLDLNV